MGLFIGDSEPSKIFVGDTPISKVFLGDTQIRPSGWQPGANTIARWKLDGDTTDEMGNFDLSTRMGSLSYGTLSGGEQYGIFDGNTVLSVASVPNWTKGTISMWYNKIGTGEHVPFAQNLDQNNSNAYTQMIINDSIIWFYASGGPDKSWNYSYTLNTWRNVVMTQDGNGVNVYVNGQSVGSTFANSSWFNYHSSSNQLCVGGLARGTQSYSKSNGYLSNVILESKVWTAQEVLDYYNQTKANYEWQPDANRTIFYYDFEDSNNRLADTSGNGNDATSAVSMSYQTVGNQTVANVDANHGYISVDGTIGGSIGSGDFAISFWHYPINPNYNYPMMFGLYEDNSPYYGPNIFYDPNNTNGQGDAVLFRMRGGASSYQHPSTTTASSLYNSRHHIVMTRISGTVSCYIDSVLETSWSGDTEQFPTSNASGYIISRGDSGQSFPAGAMGDKFILENVGRMAQDVSNYYNQTKGNYGIS